MDGRWTALKRDSLRDIKVILHPTATLNQIRMGVAGTASDDSVDLTRYLTQASHTQFDANVTLNFNRELFGERQPRPNQNLEIQMFQNGTWKPLWIGIVDAISSFTMSRGGRSMQLIAKSRDSQLIWRDTKRVTPLFPMMTDLVYIAQRIARMTGMTGGEISLPPSSFSTAHSNTQLSGMTAWDMINAIFLPMGWTPFIDGLGRLRAANRDLQSRQPDHLLEDWQVVRVGAQRQRSPITRVRIVWLNPTLKRVLQQGRILANDTVTMGFWRPNLTREIYFSSDRTQRAEQTHMMVKTSANNWWHWLDEKYQQTTENGGEILLHNTKYGLTFTLLAIWMAATLIPDGVWTVGFIGSGGSTFPVGSAIAAIAGAAYNLSIMNMGTGIYEIWGIPFEWVHARNTTEAFDSSAPEWIDNGTDIESDFVANEPHAQMFAVRELIYTARSANKWSVTLVDIPGIEMGDIIEFSDGSKMYVLDFSRQLERGTEATVEVTGFLMDGRNINSTVDDPILGPLGSIDDPSGGGSGGDGGGDPGGEGGGGEGLPATAPDIGWVLTELLATGYNVDHDAWDLANPLGNTFDQTAPNGRGAFTEQAANRCHSLDPNWGHIDKPGAGQNKYNNHAVDAIMYKCGDGVTGEIFDIITSSGGVGQGFVDRTVANLILWKWPP